jgi:hypothetical protein
VTPPEFEAVLARSTGKQLRLEVDNYREDSDSEYQHQPFQIVILEEAGKVQGQYGNGNDVKNQH